MICLPLPLQFLMVSAFLMEMYFSGQTLASIGESASSKGQICVYACAAHLYVCTYNDTGIFMFYMSLLVCIARLLLTSSLLPSLHLHLHARPKQFAQTAF